jgi:hypothetical protein
VVSVTVRVHIEAGDFLVPQMGADGVHVLLAKA